MDQRFDDTLRVADLGCGLLPLLEDFVSLASACGARKLEYCGLEKEAGVAQGACKVGGVGGWLGWDGREGGEDR